MPNEGYGMAIYEMASSWFQTFSERFVLGSVKMWIFDLMVMQTGVTVGALFGFPFNFQVI